MGHLSAKSMKKRTSPWKKKLDCDFSFSELVIQGGKEEKTGRRGPERGEKAL